MGAAAAPSRKAAHRPPEPFSPAHDQRHALDRLQRSAPAGFAGAIWFIRHCGEPVLPLAPCGDLAAHPGSFANPRRPSGPSGFEPAFLGQHRCSCSSTRGRHPQGQRRKKGIGGEALGRSHGGFSTKIHIRAEGLGKPVTVTLAGGEVLDSRALATLMGTGWITTRHPAGDPDPEQ